MNVSINTGASGLRRVTLYGAPFDLATHDDVARICLEWIRGDRQPRMVMTLNTALLMMMRKDPALREACIAGELIVADGMGVVWGSRLLGRRLPQRVAGVDVMSRLLAEADRNRLRVYLLGAKPDVVNALAEKIRRDHPNAVIAGVRDGYFSEAQRPEVARAVRESRADILFIGMPSPFKEVWAHAQREALGTPVIIGVGGSFDVLAGFTRRAPLWVQRAGMEWAWRLAMEPRRLWKRYLVTNSQFLMATLGELRRTRFGRQHREAGA